MNSEKDNAHWPSLKHLTLRRNLLSSLEADIVRRQFSHLQVLDLSCNTFSEAPIELALLSSLRTLDMSHNVISNLDNFPQNFAQLKHLNLSHNSIQSTRGLEKLWGVKRLDLSYNQIQSVQEILAVIKLPELVELGVAHNPIPLVHTRFFKFASCICRMNLTAESFYFSMPEIRN
jgi:Leucine-rich repeat (LRR) protein